MDIPAIALNIAGPSTLSFNQVANLKITLEKTSFSNPQKVRLTLMGEGFNNIWEIESLDKTTELPIELSNLPLMTKNKFIVKAIWSDQSGKEYAASKELIIIGKADSFSERVKMFLNRIVNFFS